jgi:hypothetical protein
VAWSVSRLDLFCDVQGWQLDGNERDRFVCRAQRRDTHEENEELTGFEFGRRTTGTLAARIYDKTLQVATKGIDYWPAIWGPDFDPDCPVLRVEFEIGRQGLGEFGITTPSQALERAPGVWAAATEEWLTYRERTGDTTKSRWPVAAEWRTIQQAQLRGAALGLERVRAGRGAGRLRVIVPALVGYLARMAQLVGVENLDEALGALRALVLDDEQRRGVLFADRVAALHAAELFE